MNKENNCLDECRAETFPLKRTPTEPEGMMKYNQKNYEVGKGSMDSFITVRRPPRNSKQSIGSTSSVTIHNDRPQSTNASIHRHRSSSQPRLSQSTDSSSSTAMHSSSRSFSQPRASQNAHFLDAFNVDGCFDVRTIPDPPTPSPSNSRRRQRRRVSSAVLRPMSSMEFNIRETSEVRDNKSSLTTRRKRKTLSHIPSPLNLEGDGKVGSEERSETKVKAKGLQIEMCPEDYEDEIAKLSPKRKKKRQSMVIPRELPLEASDCSSNTTGKSRSDKKSAPEAKKGFTKLDFKSMQKLRNLVRGYCALSSDDERGSSNEAKEILSISGYTLPKKIATADSKKSEAVLSNRRLVIQKIAPVLAQMESRKKRDIESWEKKTGCRVTKSEKSGRYKYYDIESNKKVGSQEYKRRYIAVLQDERPKRLSSARLWMNELKNGSNTSCTREEPDSSFQADEEYSSHENNLPFHEHTISIHINPEEQNQIDRDTMQQREDFLPPTTNNLVQDRIMRGRDFGSDDYVDACASSMIVDQKRDEHQSRGIVTMSSAESVEIAEITEASSEDTDDNPEGSRVSSPTNSTTSEFFVTGKDPKEEIPLLPLPSKDAASMDPEIAAAEKRLWDKIDLALHEYSGEVMMIEKKRKRAAKTHPENI